jgi:hypothetical protein
MGGFLIDVVIRSIIRSVRRERRVANALSWPTVEGKISMFRLGNEFGDHVFPGLTFSYEVNGETFYGSVNGNSIESKQINRVTDAINSIRTIHVRYDPADLGSSRLLNQDNPEIPFEIDHASN